VARSFASRFKPTPATVVALLAVVFATVGIAVAASTPAKKTGVVHACYATSGDERGLLRVVKGRKCGKGERALAFNRRGPRGRRGKTGRAGTAAQFTPPEGVHVVGAAGEPGFLAGASNSSGAFLPAGFYKDQFGTVHLQGTVTTGTPTASVFTLPAGYRPAGSVCVAVPAFVSTTVTTNRICVNSSGLVSNDRGTGSTFLSLDGVSFRTP
jgi:hypothetical protein